MNLSSNLLLLVSEIENTESVNTTNNYKRTLVHVLLHKKYIPFVISKTLSASILTMTIIFTRNSPKLGIALFFNFIKVIVI